VVGRSAQALVIAGSGAVLGSQCGTTRRGLRPTQMRPRDQAEHDEQAGGEQDAAGGQRGARVGNEHGGGRRQRVS